MRKLKFAFFRPSGAFFCARWAITPPKAVKRGEEGSAAVRRQNLARAPPLPSASALGSWPACPPARPCVPLGAGQGSLFRALRFAAAGGRACGLRSARWSLAVRVGRAAAAAQWGALRWRQGWRLARASCCRPSAPSPPVSPPFRRPRAWSCRCWAWGGGGATPAPAGRLRVGGLGGLAAGRALVRVRATGWRVAFASCRRARGPPTGACVGGCAAFGRRWGGALLLCFAGACPPSPAAPTGRSPLPPVVLAFGSHPSGNLSGGRGARSRALLPLVAVGCAQGARPCIPAVVGGLPPAVGVRAPLAAPRAPSRAFARRSPSSSGGQLTALKGAAILQRERMGDGHAPFRRSDRRPSAAIRPEAAQKAPARARPHRGRA